MQPVVSTAAYEPAGPLSSLSLGNGLTETRSFDSRYHPGSIAVSGGATPLLDWQYTTDSVGNVTSITDTVNPANNRSYGYQDFQYYLTQGDGPWGTRAYTYDGIGNRLTETRDGATSRMPLEAIHPSSIGSIYPAHWKIGYFSTMRPEIRGV